AAAKFSRLRARTGAQSALPRAGFDLKRGWDMSRQIAQPDRPELLRQLRQVKRELEEKRQVLAAARAMEAYREKLRVRNEELERAQQSLRESRDRYAELYDFAPVAYATLDLSGLIEDINLVGARLLGVDRSRAVGLPFLTFIAEEGRAMFLRHMNVAR